MTSNSKAIASNNNIALLFSCIEVTDESDTTNIQLTPPFIIRGKKRFSFTSVKDVRKGEELMWCPEENE